MSFLKNVSEHAFEGGIRTFLETAPALYLPGVSIDTVIFSFHNEQLKVLLLRFGNTPHFNLPGGFIKKEEHLDDAARRILQERTGLKNIYLEQFYTAGNTARSSNAVVHEVLKKFI